MGVKQHVHKLLTENTNFTQSGVEKKKMMEKSSGFGD